MSLLHALAELAGSLDQRGLFSEADVVTDMLKAAAGAIDVAPPFGKEEAQIIADAIGLDLGQAKFDVHDFINGLHVELEHGVRDPETDVVHTNYLNVGRIAWAHLKEDPDYYDKLKLVEKD